MLPILFGLLLSVMLYPTVLAAEQADIELKTDPVEPLSFQPFTEDNKPAKVTITVKDSTTGEFIKNARIKFSVDHRRGHDILNTGFPYLEGKHVLGGSFVAPEGKLEFSYVFPIRGNYDVKVEAFPTELSAQFSPKEEEFKVHVREHSYEVRNAIILGTILLFLGVFIGVIYGRASIARGGK
jgi:hypothetical protein